jgi:hypothetical protein
VFFNKLKANWLSPGVLLERLGDVQSPTLVLIGDDDCVAPEHAAAMVRALPAGSRLRVVPGTSHGLPSRNSTSLTSRFSDFVPSDSRYRAACQSHAGLILVSTKTFLQNRGFPPRSQPPSPRCSAARTRSSPGRSYFSRETGSDHRTPRC